MTQSPWHNQKIAVFGEMTADCFASGRATRISNEAPIPVIVVDERTVSPGCGGNALMNFHSLGTHPLLCAPLGHDAAAKQLRDYLGSRGLTTDYCPDLNHPTTSKTRILAGPQQVARFDEEHPLTTLRPSQEVNLRRTLGKLRQQTSTILVTDYGYNWVTPQTRGLIRELWDNGTIICDPQAHTRVDYSGVHALTPNLKEACFLLGAPMQDNTDSAAEHMAQALIQKFDLKFVLLTRSERGVTLLERDGDPLHLPAQAVTIAEVSGAGDSVAATLTCALAAGLPLAEAAILANRAGAAAVSHSGLYHLTYTDIVPNSQKSSSAAA